MNNNLFRKSDEKTTRFLANALLVCIGLFVR